MQLVEPALAARGLPSVRAHVRVADLTSFAAVFVTNARGVAAVGQVDDQKLRVDQDFMRTLATCHDEAPWDPL